MTLYCLLLSWLPIALSKCVFPSPTSEYMYKGLYVSPGESDTFSAADLAKIFDSHSMKESKVCLLFSLLDLVCNFWLFIVFGDVSSLFKFSDPSIVILILNFSPVSFFIDLLIDPMSLLFIISAAKGLGVETTSVLSDKFIALVDFNQVSKLGLGISNSKIPNTAFQITVGFF